MGNKPEAENSREAFGGPSLHSNFEKLRLLLGIKDAPKDMNQVVLRIYREGLADVFRGALNSSDLSGFSPEDLKKLKNCF